MLESEAIIYRIGSILIALMLFAGVIELDTTMIVTASILAILLIGLAVYKGLKNPINKK